jgi:tetratricopeptide (TPR) repeat protein
MGKRILFFLLLSSSLLHAQKSIRQANKLIAVKKYRSAWEVLDKSDPKNEKSTVALAKTDLLLNYFINTVMHKVFTLKDLQLTEKAEDFRGKDENGNLIKFDPEAVLDTLIQQHPNDYKLYEGLGNYYYNVFLLFQENWLKKPEELVTLIESNYTKASDHGIKSYLVSYRIGFAQLFLQNYTAARKSFRESVSQNSQYADAHYSLAYSCLQLNLLDTALISANRAYELFTDTFNRSDVYLLRGMIYGTKNDTVACLREYSAAASLNPKNQSMSLMLLKAELRYHGRDLNTVSSGYFDMAPNGPETYNELINDYFKANKPTEILAFLDAKEKQYSASPEVMGNICFYRAYVYVVMDEKAKAKADLLLAKENFLKVFPPGHEMFGTIEEALKDIDKP